MNTPLKPGNDSRLTWPGLPVIVLLCLFVGFGSSTAWAGCPAPYVDPRQSANGYAEWCKCQGGTVYNDARGYGCDVSASGGSSGSVSLSPSEQLLMKSMEQFFHNLFWGSDQQNERQRQIEKLQQKEWERRQAEEAARRKIEEEQRKIETERRRREFAKQREGLLSKVKGESTSTIGLKDLRDIEGTSSVDPFGIKTLKPRDVSGLTEPLRPKGLKIASFRTSLQRASCSAYLLRKSYKAAAEGRYEESAYLSHEAADLMSGVTDSPGVVCPPPPEVPVVEGVPLKESKEQAEKLKKQTIVMSRLYSRGSQQVADYRVIRNSATQAEQKVKEAKTLVEEARAKKEKLEAQRQQLSDEITAREITEKPAPIQKPENESAMKEALEALCRAEAALEASEQDLAGYMEGKADMEKQMQDTRELFMQATESPDKLNEIYEEFSSKHEKGDQR